jgi:hypothetical protein
MAGPLFLAWVNDGGRPFSVSRQRKRGKVTTCAMDIPEGSITIRFKSAQYLTLKVDAAKVEDGVLILYVYSKDRGRLQATRIYPIVAIEAAQLSDGTVVYGEPIVRSRR